MSDLDQQINTICDVLARDSGFVATQDAMHQSKRAGEAARGQQVLNPAYLALKPEDEGKTWWKLEDITPSMHPDAYKSLTTPKNPDATKQISMQAGPLKKTALQECSDYHAKLAGKFAIAGNLELANTHLNWSVACAEANEQ